MFRWAERQTAYYFQKVWSFLFSRKQQNSKRVPAVIDYIINFHKKLEKESRGTLVKKSRYFYWSTSKRNDINNLVLKFLEKKYIFEQKAKRNLEKVLSNIIIIITAVFGTALPCSLSNFGRGQDWWFCSKNRLICSVPTSTLLTFSTSDCTWE